VQNTPEELAYPFRLSTRIRNTFLFILFLSVVYIGFSFVSALSVFELWQQKRFEMIEQSAKEFLSDSKKNISYANYALKPRKTDLAEFVETDNFRSIEIVLDEMRVLYELDGAFLQNEYGQLIDFNGLVINPSKSLRSFLNGLDDSPDFRLFDDLDASKDRVYNFSSKGLYVGVKVPIRYDVGDVAGHVYFIRQVIAPGQIRFKSELLKDLEYYEFKARESTTEAESAYISSWKQMLNSLLFSQLTVFKMPVFSNETSDSIGVIEMFQSTDEILPVFKTQVALGVIPILLLTLSLLFFYRLLMQRMLCPVEEMSDVTKKIYEGHSDVRLTFMRGQKNNRFSEVDALGIRFNELMDALETQKHDLTILNEELESIVLKRTIALTDTNEKLEKLAHTDALTGIANRHAFDIYWASIEERARRQVLDTVGFCIIDCDYFKGINDTYGHHAGDQVLVIITDLIQAAIEPGARLFRLGGDEFAVIYEREPLVVIEKNMQTLARAVSQYPVDEINIKEQLSSSIGISYANKNELTTNLLDLFRHADTAMYVAKRSLRQKYIVYDAEKHAGTYEELKHQHVHSVLDAIKTGDGLSLYYQPIFDIRANRVDYFEVLTRLEIDNETVFPNVFLPIVERTNLTVQFDKMVVSKVLEALELGEIPKGSGVSINLSADAIVDSQIWDWFKPLLPYLSEYRIIIEITETTLITQLNEVSSYIDQFKKVGFEVALDDFGSGYSSISYLAHLPVNIIKFDISLARAAFQKQRSAKLIQSLIDDLSEMGYGIVVEGIEDLQMYDALALMKPSHFQGYYINRPSPMANADVSHLHKGRVPSF